MWTRREFLTSLTALGAAVAADATWAAGRAALDPIPLGFDNFSVRTCNWKAPQLIRYAASLQVDTLLLSDLDVYERLEDDYLARIRDLAEQSGIALQVGTGSICPTSQSYDARRWGPAEEHARLLVRVAKQLGSPVARCYLGSQRDRHGEGGIYRHFEPMAQVLRAVRGAATDAGVKIAIENHAGDMQAWELVELIEAAGREFVGATMDPGNAVWSLEDPILNLEILGPYALTTGIRDSMVWETPEGARAMWVNMGLGLVDWPAYLQRYRELCPRVPFVLEVISYKWAYDLPYLQPDFWSLFPRARAPEFARFVALARRGSPYVAPADRPAGDASDDLEGRQQQHDLEAGLRYCREVLGLGTKVG